MGLMRSKMEKWNKNWMHGLISNTKAQFSLCLKQRHSQRWLKHPSDIIGATTKTHFYLLTSNAILSRGLRAPPTSGSFIYNTESRINSRFQLDFVAAI